MEQVLRDNDLSRTHWQVLNLVHENAPAARANLVQTLRPFVDAERVDNIVRDLEGRGWLNSLSGNDPNAPAIELTDEGRLVHSDVSQLIRAFRGRARHGISDEEYVAAIRMLARMAANLETSNEAKLRETPSTRHAPIVGG